MKSRIYAIFIICLMLFLMIAPISAMDTSSYNANDNKFVVGFDSEFPPFGYKDANGEYTGFDIELAKEVCKRNNWTFVAQPLSGWAAKEMELDSGLIDCIWSELTINGRENDYLWSKPYFNSSQVVVVKSNSGIEKLEDLKGKNVEVQEGSSVLKVLDGEKKALKDSFGSFNLIHDYNTGFMDLATGVCDAIIVDIPSAKYQLVEKNSTNGYKILEEQIASEQYGIGFKKGNTELKNQVQATLDEMYKDGTVEKIADKYKHYGISDGLIKT